MKRLVEKDLWAVFSCSFAVNNRFITNERNQQISAFQKFILNVFAQSAHKWAAHTEWTQCPKFYVENMTHILVYNKNVKFLKIKMKYFK